MKKILNIPATAFFSICAVAAVAGVAVAYLTTARGLVNKFTVGNNTIDIVEKYEPPKELTQGINTYSKKVQVENTGKTDAFVRVYAEFSDSDIANNSYVTTSAPGNVSIDSTDTADVVKSKMTAAGYKAHDEFWKEGGPDNDWVYISTDTDPLLGGYFYYTQPVKSSESEGATKDNVITNPLIEKVATYFESANDVKDYEIIVYAESVQTTDKDGVEFTGNDAYKDAWTEFLTRKDTSIDLSHG